MEKDFFISRAGADRAIAVVIASIVNRAGFSTWLQDEDFGHASFMARMAEGYASGARMIALLSRDYQQSEHCKAEYEHILTNDPRNRQEQLIVLRIDAIAPVEHLKAMAYTDLVPVLNDASALERAVRVAIGVDPPSAEFPLHRQEAKTIHPEVVEVAGFTGRAKELKAIDEVLFNPNVSASTAAALTDTAGARATLQGLGGVGKSVLAKQYAWQYQESFAGIWWIRAESTQTLDEDLLALGARFIVGIETDPNRERAVQTVLNELVRQSTADSTKPWLLIYDNVEQPKNLERRLPQKGVKVLITSRWTDWYPQAAELPVDTFQPEVAIDYLLARARNEDTASAAALAKDLGYLPLALDHARTYCWQSYCRFTHYQSRIDELMDKVPANASYPKTVYATFSLAIERAVEECPVADNIISALSLLAPDAIPIDLVAELCESDAEKEAVLGALTNVSLLTDAPLEDGTSAFNQHRLVQAVARSRIADNRETIVERALAALNSLWPSGNEGSHPNNWPLCARLLPHATALLDGIGNPSTNDKSIGLLAAFIGFYVGHRGDLKAQERWGKKCLEIRQRVLGEEHPDTASSYNNVAYNLNAQGRYEEAEPLFRKGLEIRQRVLGEEHPSTATSYNNVAYNLDAQGRYEEAEPLFRKGFEISQRVLGEEHPNTRAFKSNLEQCLKQSLKAYRI